MDLIAVETIPALVSFCFNSFYGISLLYEKAETFFSILKALFSSDTHQSMKRHITTEIIHLLVHILCFFDYFPHKFSISIFGFVLFVSIFFVCRKRH